MRVHAYCTLMVPAVSPELGRGLNCYMYLDATRGGPLKKRNETTRYTIVLAPLGIEPTTDHEFKYSVLSVS